MVVLPERYSYVEFYLSLRCNFNCSYCINEYTGVSRKRRELSAREWVLGLNNIQTSLPLTFGGGEPTIHNEFYEIINGLRPDSKIDLLTNGMLFDLSEFLEKAPPSRFSQFNPEYKSIRMSYHPKSTDQAEIVRRAAWMQDKGYPVGIFGLNHPENLRVNVEMTERCRVSGVYFFIRDFLGYYDDLLYGTYMYRAGLNGNRKRCQCRTEELLVGPDGAVYRCHRDLYDGMGEIGNILNMAFQVEDVFRACNNLGLCNPCDMKKKLGPDLIANKCSVEIKDIQ